MLKFHESTSTQRSQSMTAKLQNQRQQSMTAKLQNQCQQSRTAKLHQQRQQSITAKLLTQCVLVMLSQLASKIGEVWQFAGFGFANNVLQLFDWLQL